MGGLAAWSLAARRRSASRFPSPRHGRGAPSTNDVNPDALAHLAETRQLLFAGKYVEARDLCQKYLLGRPASFGTNLPSRNCSLASIMRKQLHSIRRSLNLDEAIARVSFRAGRHAFRARSLHRIRTARLLCASPATSLGRSASAQAFGAVTMPADIATKGQDTLILRGHAYERMAQQRTRRCSSGDSRKGDSRRGSVWASAQGLQVKSANAVTILIAAGTNFDGGNPEDACARALAQASSKSYAQLRVAHIADHQALYRRVALDLSLSTTTVRTQPTDVRRKALASGAKPILKCLRSFFNYGRYLTIAGSRADSPLTIGLAGYLERRPGEQHGLDR